MTCNWGKRGAGFLLICACFVLCQDLAFAQKVASKAPDPSKLMLEAQGIVSEEQKASYEKMPLEESARDGYWWNKQDKGEKLAIVKELIAGFGLEDKKLSVKKIVSQLDIEYNPRDNPLDIKMDKSIERMFNIITMRMILE
ncbi:MAG: hypothetical protein KKH57_00465 [Candidatus Omnitrophica bacterium]|nr:hypothetical protein [Candidatus Omnitrophota bacterium]